MNFRKLLFVTLMCIVSFALYATPLLNENFEGTQFPPTSWTTIDDTQAGTVNHWMEVTGKSAISLQKSAYCDGGSYSSNEPIKEEFLVTPQITLTDATYKLQFLWEGAAVASLQNKEYDFQVRVSEDNGTTWTTIWSFLNKKNIEDSGVTFPWPNWGVNTSIINLSAYKNKTIKVAFVHCNLIGGVGNGNCVFLDDVLVETYTPIVAPIAAGTSTYKFKDVYVGSKVYSEPMTLSNAGVDTLRITSIDGLTGTDYSVSFDASKVKLGQNQSYEYQVAYQPTLTGTPNVTMTIHTNGGDLDVQLQGTKKMIPTGYHYEGFEGNQFAPVGWTIHSDKSQVASEWEASNYALIGDKSAKADLTKLTELISPRLDLSTGAHHIEFTYFENFQPRTEGVTAPDNYFLVYMSTDGGNNWREIFSNDTLNKIKVKELDLGSPASDNCYVKFVYDLSTLNLSGGYDNLPEFSTIYIDNVILPPFFGSASTPLAATNPIPADNAVDQEIKDLKLQWDAVQFATAYKVYAGKDNTFALVDAVEVTNTEYTLPDLEYATSYVWKVVPTNATGDALNPIEWHFTTMADPTISSFPYFEGFEGATFPPLGWNDTHVEYCKWSTSSYKPFDGANSATASGNKNNVSLVLKTMPIALPSDKDMQLSFYWGNHLPVGLDKPKSPADEAEVGADTLYCEVLSDAGNWIELAHITAPSDEDQGVWKRERIELQAYKGKTIEIRWRYSVVDGFKSTGASLDNVKVEEIPTLGNIILNKSLYEFGEVNYKKSVASQGLNMTNDSQNEMTIDQVTFNTKHFASSLVNGQVLQANEKVNYIINYNALENVGANLDTMKVLFTNGLVVKLPVNGQTLAQDVLFFNFENDAFASTTPEGFSVIDVDQNATIKPVMIHYPNIGTPFAFIVMNELPEPEGADWRNIYPRSGHQQLAAIAPSEEARTAEDWIVSKKLTATTSSQFRFYAKSYGSDFDFASISIWVSTTDTDKDSFTQLASFGNKNLEHIGNNAQGSFTEYTADLSSYDGQAIFIALKHEVSGKGFVSFFDDFYYEHFVMASTGNVAPTFTMDDAYDVTVNEAMKINFAVFDADGDDLTIEGHNMPNWVSLKLSSNGGELTGTPTDEGKYVFTITATDGTLTTTHKVTLNVTDGTGVEIVKVEMDVYQNNDEIVIENAQVESIAIYNMMGACVKQVSNVNRVSVSDLNTGVYILRIKGSKSAIVKVIIQ